jgi:hypothetical protein
MKQPGIDSITVEGFTSIRSATVQWRISPPAILGLTETAGKPLRTG